MNVQSTATYPIAIRTAAVAASTMHIEDETAKNLTGSIAVPVSGGFQAWQTVTTKAALNSGAHVLKVVVDSGNASMNLNDMTIGTSSTATGSTGIAPTTAPIATSAPVSTQPTNYNSASSFPSGFWDATNIPAAKNVMMFKFLNRTNGKYPDSQVYWSVNINGQTQTHSIADQPTFDMPANSSGRIYFSLGSVGTGATNYYDFLEYTIGAAQFNGNTTRVDAFGIKLAMQLHNADGSVQTVGENAATFAEDRATTFARFVSAVPAEFKGLAQTQAPYRILNPGAGGFDTGGKYATYYSAYVDQVWAQNGLTIPKPGPNGDGLGSYPDLSAALYRHTAGPGTFSPSGQLLSQSIWADPAKFYTAAPADYYAKFWHDNAVDGKAYGFPYDDVGGYSSYISHANPQYMLVGIGW